MPTAAPSIFTRLRDADAANAAEDASVDYDTTMPMPLPTGVRSCQATAAAIAAAIITIIIARGRMPLSDYAFIFRHYATCDVFFLQILRPPRCRY
jgi:hypothetical protein